jgi:hypothetical protein
MARTADSPELKAAKELAKKVVDRLQKEGHLGKDDRKVHLQLATEVVLKHAQRDRQVEP